MKKVLGLCLLLILIFTYFPLPIKNGNAQEKYSAIVTTDLLNVRAKATTNSKKIGTVKKGEILEVYEKDINGWAKIKYKDKTGFVSAAYLKYDSKQSELSVVKKWAVKGTSNKASKIKVGDLVSKAIKGYGKVEGWGMREYHVLEYKDFSVQYFGQEDKEGGYSLYTSQTKIAAIRSSLAKPTKWNELQREFGNKVTRTYSYIPMKVQIMFDLGDFIIYFESIEDVENEQAYTIPLSELTFGYYSINEK